MILPILQYGDPVLRAKGKPIEAIGDRIRELAENMIDTMHAAHGVGLAAQQIGKPLQLTVLDVSAVEDRPSTLKLDGKDTDPKAAMFLARAIQHEGDHLNGILFIDRMRSAAKAALSSRLRRLQKETKRGIRHGEELVTETTL